MAIRFQENFSLIGSTISRYRVLERLGGGGAGVVYKAEDQKLERLVALKFLSTYRNANESDKRRFLREARASSAVDHPNICTVYEIDETEDGRLFIAMAFCEGETLKRRIERGGLAIAEAVRLAAQIASGLAAAHAKGIVHRDVKPANIIVAPDGRVKIVDFGIAKLADQSRLTRDGTAVGTAGYMAPEQIRGETIDPRTDIWALGVVLYEMVTGRTPFPGETDHDRIRAILSRDPEPMAVLRPGVPAQLERIVVRALAKRVDDRYASVEAMRDDLLALNGGALNANTGTLGISALDEGLDPTLRDIPSSPSAGTTVFGDADHLVGRMIAHYRVVDYIGGGGMGVVYRAEDLRLERTVALKFLPPELTRDPESKVRFLQEARSASVLDHPNICTIHEVGETDDGRLYLAMPYYDGETLRRLIERGPIPIDEAIDIGEQISRGLAKAHRGGIVHRDIKPANIMVTADGVVKILDFGLAKLAGAAAITRTGSSVGTPAYMSPEQARGEDVDHRTDLWSFGVVLYELIAGRRPFRGEHDQAVLYGILNEKPKPLSEVRSEAPPELERIVDGLLAKSPGDRYPTAEGPLGDLRALRNQTMTTTVRTQPDRPVPSRTHHPWFWAAALLAAVALVAGVIYLRRPAGGRAGAWSTAGLSFNRLTDQEGRESFPSLSPDGRSLLYVKSLNGNADIYLQRVGGGNPQNLTPDSPADDTQPAFSPDGQQIAFRSDREGGGLFIMGATGESARRLTGIGYNPAWSPDGHRLVFATEEVSRPLERRLNSQLWTVDIVTGQQQPLVREDAVQPSWSPHGQRIAYWGLPKGSGRRLLWTVPAGGGTPVRVTNDDHINWNPVWSPDGNYLYFVSDRSGSMNVWRMPIDEGTGKVLGEPEPITTSSQSTGLLSLARDGRRIVYATDEGKSNLERRALDPVTHRASGEAVPVTQGSRAVRSAAVSPDGEWIAFDIFTPQEDIFLLKADGTRQSQLTADVAKDRIPHWLADGQHLLFYSDRGGSYGAWTIRMDGSERQPIPHGTPDPLFTPIPSPDGRRFVASLGSRSAALIDPAQPLDRRARLLPAPGDGQVFAANSWSADGAYLAGNLERTSDGSNIPGVVLYSFATGRYERLSDVGSIPVWLHDGRTLLYLHEGKIFQVDLRSKVSSLVLEPPANSFFNSLAVGPDDRALYAVRVSDEGDIWMITPAGGDDR